LVIYNAGAAAADQLVSELERVADQFDLTWHASESGEDIVAAARAAAARGCPRIVAFGGDGTLHHALNGIAPEFGPELALVPGGTGNDLARATALALDSVPEALHHALTAPATPVDVMRITTDSVAWAVNVANGGLGGTIARDMRKGNKSRWGALAYWVAALFRLQRMDTWRVRIDIDGRILKFRTQGLAVANGRFVGGGFPVASEAYLDDGWLNLVVAPVLSPFEAISAAINLLLRRHRREHRVQMFPARRVHIRATPPMPFSIDGEPARTMDATFELVPRALRLVVGTDAPAIESQETGKAKATDPSDLSDPVGPVAPCRAR
jgi:YegS/Rv2252/BmrU family lipid kinase